jgi:tight adherence protein B
MELLIIIGIFLSTVFVIEGGYFALTTIRNKETKKIRKRLSSLSTEGYGSTSVDIVRKKSLSDIPWFNRILLHIPSMNKIYLTLEQANIQYPPGFFILLSTLLIFAAYFGGSLFIRNPLFLIPGAAFLGTIPFLYILLKKRKRMQKFESQLPDALELIARSLKAGHALPSGLKIVSLEFDDPIGTEFDKTLDEINFGISIDEALKNLSKRIDCPDIKFFVISVILQRETGGNLAEILESIGRVIRKRFKFKGNVRTLSAEGKLSAIILIALPFFFATVITFMNPKYINTLIFDPVGKMMVFFAMLMMVIGTFVITRMIKIEV